MTTAISASVIDPVCGMTIDPADAAATSHYGDTTFHFCNPSCKTAFDAAPARYAAPAEPAATACCGGRCH